MNYLNFADSADAPGWSAQYAEWRQFSHLLSTRLAPHGLRDTGMEVWHGVLSPMSDKVLSPYRVIQHVLDDLIRSN